MKTDIVIQSTNDWNGFWFQRQEFASRLAADGHRVFFLNRVPQRIPRPGRILRWLQASRQGAAIENPVPAGVRVLKPRLLPPVALLRPINRFLWRRLWSALPPEERPLDPILISYQPSYSILDLIPIIQASRVIYVNTHNYDADPSCPADLLRSEARLVRRADALMADAAFNASRLQRYGPLVPVSRAMPGVSVARFAAAYRGDEVERRRKVFFFGDIGKHLDVPLYNALAERFEVVLIGIADAAVAAGISERIRILPPVAPADLPAALRDADVLTIFYKPSAYVDGILPAKFFECLATGKPLIVSGLKETAPYAAAVYDAAGDADQAAAFIQALPSTETRERRAARKAFADSADWERRYEQFKHQGGIE